MVTILSHDGFLYYKYYNLDCLALQIMNFALPYTGFCSLHENVLVKMISCLLLHLCCISLSPSLSFFARS